MPEDCDVNAKINIDGKRQHNISGKRLKGMAVHETEKPKEYTSGV